jgi:hypothetical protein
VTFWTARIESVKEEAGGGGNIVDNASTESKILAIVSIGVTSIQEG